MRAVSARSSIGIRSVRATVLLPTGVAWAITFFASFNTKYEYTGAKFRN
jgi:hypothetical protein